MWKDEPCVPVPHSKSLVSVEQYCVESAPTTFQAIAMNMVSVEQYCVESKRSRGLRKTWEHVSVEQYCVERDWARVLVEFEHGVFP